MKIKDDDLARYAITGLAFVLFVGLTVWLVHAEGERTRRTIREAISERRERAVNWPEIPNQAPTLHPPSPVTEPQSDTAKPTPDASVVPTTSAQGDADFDLDDRDIFPGLPPPSKKDAKSLPTPPPQASGQTDQSNPEEKPQQQGPGGST